MRVASIEEKMVESCLMLFVHVQRRQLDMPVMIVDQMVWSPSKWGRERPKKILNEIILRDLLVNHIHRKTWLLIEHNDVVWSI